MFLFCFEEKQWIFQFAFATLFDFETSEKGTKRLEKSMKLETAAV